jgi:hypothetical protein
MSDAPAAGAQPHDPSAVIPLLPGVKFCPNPTPGSVRVSLTFRPNSAPATLFRPIYRSCFRARFMARTRRRSRAPEFSQDTSLHVGRRAAFTSSTRAYIVNARYLLRLASSWLHCRHAVYTLDGAGEGGGAVGARPRDERRRPECWRRRRWVPSRLSRSP